MWSHVEKKTKVSWTKDLHKKFLEAIEKLGIDNAVPKKILQLMDVDGLTRDHVASHLQKYRILSKKIANANYCVQTASKPCLLESSTTNGTSWSNSTLMLNQEQMSWPSYSAMHAISPPILDTSRSYFPVVEASDFATTVSPKLTQWFSSPNKGYSMQESIKDLEEQRNFMDDSHDTINLGVANLVNSGFVQNLGDFLDDYDGCSSEAQIYNNFEMHSSGCVQHSINSSFVHNPNGFESNCSSKSEYAEIGSLYGADSNINLENKIGEDDLILDDVDIAYLLSYADDNDLHIHFDAPNQDVNWQNFPNNVSSYSNHDEEPTSLNKHQTLDGYLPGFDQTFKHMDEQFMEPIWSHEHVADDLTPKGLILNSYFHA